MRTLVLPPFVALALMTGATAAPLEGTWKVTWPCDPKTVVGVKPDRCDSGEDVFVLQLMVSEGLICGAYVTTAHLGDRVEDGTVFERRTGSRAAPIGQAARLSIREGTSSHGVAVVRIRGAELHWKLSQPPVDTMLPVEAVLARSGENVGLVDIARCRP
jgi:hypothetical protein